MESTTVLNKFRKMVHKSKDETRDSKITVKMNKKKAEETQEEAKKLIENGKPELPKERILKPNSMCEGLCEKGP